MARACAGSLGLGLALLLLRHRGAGEGFGMGASLLVLYIINHNAPSSANCRGKVTSVEKPRLIRGHKFRSTRRRRRCSRLPTRATPTA
jgi:hypothetical protein